MSTVDMIKATIEEREHAKQVLANFDQTIADLRRQLTIPCASCGAIHPIGEMAYIQIVYYREPYGCTGGDYEYNSDGSEFVCPTCGTHNNISFIKSRHSVPWEQRDKFDNNPEAQFQRMYKRLFREVVEVRDSERRGDWGAITYKWCHNTWVEEHLEDFELRIACDE